MNYQILGLKITDNEFYQAFVLLLKMLKIIRIDFAEKKCLILCTKPKMILRSEPNIQTALLFC